MTSLPRLLVLTDRRAAARAGRTLAETVAGAPAVVLREKDLPPGERMALADELRPLVDLLIAASADFGTGWTHLSATDPVPAGGRWGRSCHNADEVSAAVAEGAAYVTVSPARPTPSKPAYGPPLGVDGVARLALLAGPGSAPRPAPPGAPPCERSQTAKTCAAPSGGANWSYAGPSNAPRPAPPGAPQCERSQTAKTCAAPSGGANWEYVPVYALGGISPADVRPFIDAGAYGVAVMGAVMSAPDPAAAIASLLATLSTGEQEPDGSVGLVLTSRKEQPT